MGSNGNHPVIMVSENAPGARVTWRQYLVITNDRVAIVEMIPAMISGWKFHRIIVQDSADWMGMTRDQIVASKLASAYAPAIASNLGDFRENLLAVASSGRLPERSHG